MGGGGTDRGRSFNKDFRVFGRLIRLRIPALNTILLIPTPSSVDRHDHARLQLLNKRLQQLTLIETLYPASYFDGTSSALARA
jgi:hypothetical protein